VEEVDPQGALGEHLAQLGAAAAGGQALARRQPGDEHRGGEQQDGGTEDLVVALGAGLDQVHEHQGRGQHRRGEGGAAMASQGTLERLPPAGRGGAEGVVADPPDAEPLGVVAVEVAEHAALGEPAGGPQGGEPELQRDGHGAEHRDPTAAARQQGEEQVELQGDGEEVEMAGDGAAPEQPGELGHRVELVVDRGQHGGAGEVDRRPADEGHDHPARPAAGEAASVEAAVTIAVDEDVSGEEDEDGDAEAQQPVDGAVEGGGGGVGGGHPGDGVDTDDADHGHDAEQVGSGEAAACDRHPHVCPPSSGGCRETDCHAGTVRC
jgi:hypothetical protein